MVDRTVKNQLIFRLDGPNNLRRQFQEEGRVSGERVYRARRPHRKSRTGCANCRKRRVKCDETKPRCRRCETHGVCCDYLTLQVRSQQTKPPATSGQMASTMDIRPASIQFTMSITELADRIDQVLRLDPSAEQPFFEVPKLTHYRAVASLYHFITMVADATSMSDAHRSVMTGDMIQIGLQTPYLMHAILGASATHFRLLLPHNTSYIISEAAHWQCAIQSYQREIIKPIDERNMDPLISTCMLLSLLSFATNEYKPAISWVFSSEPNALNWLLVQCGLRYILSFLSKQQQSQSIWFPIFQESDDEHQTFNNDSPGLDGLHPGLADLCKIDDTTTGETNPYHWPLRMLSPMLPLQSNKYNFTKLITFIGRLLPPYTNLLQKKDPRALLIFSYWLGKMCEEKRWWVYSRVHSECVAICMYLEDSQDPRMLELLRYPAEKCGYVLNRSVTFPENNDISGLF
ncbi:hypothetical protein GX51_03203 [Blastomyces parvus]|uniref:Zn(2)-C6 fungal-type domain-containing protein n=1 Tax=Blastomyces parvus TaxID=2060905 RepID=A0A2B7X864_9EURO|nr:hypothetical protein GX51_03203 [Blastomyces parvus]